MGVCLLRSAKAIVRALQTGSIVRPFDVPSTDQGNEKDKRDRTCGVPCSRHHKQSTRPFKLATNISRHDKLLCSPQAQHLLKARARYHTHVTWAVHV